MYSVTIIIMAVQISGCPEYEIKALAGRQTVTSRSIHQNLLLLLLSSLHLALFKIYLDAV